MTDEFDYRDILVRKLQPDGTVIEYEVALLDVSARTAAVMVYEGSESTGITVRDRFDPATGTESPHDPTRYRAVVEITAHKLTSLPERVTAPNDRENDYDRAARSAVAVYAGMIGAEDDFKAVFPALMRGVIELSFDLDVDIASLITDLGNERIEHGRDETPRLLGPYLKSLSVDLGGDTGAAQAALDHYVSNSGIEGGEDPYVAMYHLIYGVIENAEREGVDFTRAVAEMIEQAEERPTASPRF